MFDSALCRLNANSAIRWRNGESQRKTRDDGAVKTDRAKHSPSRLVRITQPFTVCFGTLSSDVAARQTLTSRVQVC